MVNHDLCGADGELVLRIEMNEPVTLGRVAGVLPSGRHFTARSIHHLQARLEHAARMALASITERQAQARGAQVPPDWVAALEEVVGAAWLLGHILYGADEAKRAAHGGGRG